MMIRTLLLLAVFFASDSHAHAETLIDSDFSKGDFQTLGWKAEGAWDVFAYKDAANNPGKLARFAANKPVGSLTKTFTEVESPRQLSLSLDYGWGWGDAGQASDAVSFLLVDAKGDGYAFKVHRTKANWAVQWGLAAANAVKGDMKWAPVEIDATHAAVRDGGGLSHLVVTRESDGSWSLVGKNWNKGAGATVRFSDSSTTTFSKLVLLGTENFDEQLFNRIVLTASTGEPVETIAIPVSAFLDSIGVVTTFPDRGQPLQKTVEMVKMTGIRWVRGGIEGLSDNGPLTVDTYLSLHKQTGVRFSWGLVSGGSDLKKLIATARPLANAGALLAFEGNNEPNNWGVTYQGEAGGGKAPSWLAVAKLQRDLYQAVKSDPDLKQYPVWSISEGGGQTDNVGLQFLTIPEGGETLMPAGTKYADAANVHNYIYHPNSPGLEDNKTWNAADPTSACRVDGLFGNYGVTWAKHFRGIPEGDLVNLPKVTTETGATIGGEITEEIHGLNILTMYLAQFKRGWSHTAVYLLRDRTDEAGNQAFGLFQSDYTPRLAAKYLGYLTRILNDEGTLPQPGKLKYLLSAQPATVHDLLLQKSDGTFQLIVWNERVHGEDEITVRFGQPVSVVVCDPAKRAKPIAAANSVDSYALKLGNHPLVLSISR